MGLQESLPLSLSSSQTLWPYSLIIIRLTHCKSMTTLHWARYGTWKLIRPLLWTSFQILSVVQVQYWVMGQWWRPSLPLILHTRLIVAFQVSIGGDAANITGPHDGRMTLRLFEPCLDPTGATCQLYEDFDHLTMAENRWYPSSARIFDGSLVSSS